jgi:hypothetical protein
MTSRYVATDNDDATRHPECSDREDEADTRQLATEPEESEDEEAGYGYGV